MLVSGSVGFRVFWFKVPFSGCRVEDLGLLWLRVFFCIGVKSLGCLRLVGC